MNRKEFSEIISFLLYQVSNSNALSNSEYQVEEIAAKRVLHETFVHFIETKTVDFFQADYWKFKLSRTKEDFYSSIPGFNSYYEKLKSKHINRAELLYHFLLEKSLCGKAKERTSEPFCIATISSGGVIDKNLGYDSFDCIEQIIKDAIINAIDQLPGAIRQIEIDSYFDENGEFHQETTKKKVEGHISSYTRAIMSDYRFPVFESELRFINAELLEDSRLALNILSEDSFMGEQWSEDSQMENLETALEVSQRKLSEASSVILKKEETISKQQTTISSQQKTIENIIVEKKENEPHYSDNPLEYRWELIGVQNGYIKLPSEKEYRESLKDHRHGIRWILLKCEGSYEKSLRRWKLDCQHGNGQNTESFFANTYDFRNSLKGEMEPIKLFQINNAFNYSRD